MPSPRSPLADAGRQSVQFSQTDRRPSAVVRCLVSTGGPGQRAGSGSANTVSSAKLAELPQAKSFKWSFSSTTSTSSLPPTSSRSLPPRFSSSPRNAAPCPENTPWETFVPVTLAEGVVGPQRLELPSDGPGVLSVVTFGPRSNGSNGMAVLCCPGCYECFEGPSCLYNRLASELPQQGYTVVQLAYRPPADDEEEATEDVMTCIDWLVKTFRSVVLVGWSMGSAAVVEAAYLRRHLPHLRGVVTLAAQTSGTRNAKHLQVPLLALHGEADTVLRPECSKTLVLRATEGGHRDVRLRLLKDDTHRVESALPQVLDFIQEMQRTK